MSKLNVDQKTIKDLFQDKKADFLIPDYQRPYAWGEAECQTLWDDIFSFAIPDDGRTEFDSNSEYFLGPIVTFKNDDAKMEVIDGQQRLTTLMLLLRAFYAKFGHMQDKASVATRQNIEKCIWKTDEFGEPDMSALKIDSEVATDKDTSTNRRTDHGCRLRELCPSDRRPGFRTSCYCRNNAERQHRNPKTEGAVAKTDCNTGSEDTE